MGAREGPGMVGGVCWLARSKQLHFSSAIIIRCWAAVGESYCSWEVEAAGEMAGPVHPGLDSASLAG